MFRKNILLFIISCSFFFVGRSQIVSDANSTPGKVIDKIIAQVGAFPILYSELKAQEAQMEKQLGEELGDTSICAMLESALFQKLLLNQAKIDSIQITQEQVNAEMENRLRVLAQKIGGREKLEEFYGKTYEQIKEKFEKPIRQRMLSQEMKRQITLDVGVSPEEVEEFFKAIPKDSIPYINEKISIQQIVIYPKITQESRNKVIGKLKEWRKEVLEGKRSFSALATIHSEDMGSAKNGGKIEATRGMMVKPFESAAFSLQVGEISPVIKTQYGYHIIQLLSRKGDNYVVRHILLTPEIGSKELSQAATLMDECYKKLSLNEITWDEAVQEYSEDEKTKQNNGTIYNPYTGNRYWDVANINQIDPQIYQLITGMEVGEISQPSLYTNREKRQQGVRIVRIKNRIDPHKANLKEDYHFIKRAAKNTKKSKIISKWVKDKVKKTYVRIDDAYADCHLQYDWE